tara:strand:- start:2367 stop:2678 length:312 start_codon:yes stop_codon:yes gene_type:complete
MGGSVGEVLDHNLNELSGALGGSKNAFNIKSSAEDVQKHYGDQITNMMNPNIDNITDEMTEILSNVDDSQSPNPFSMASYGSNVRQRKKSGFGRRQTFKGLTG